MINKLSIDQKIGQIMMIGFDGTEFSPQLRGFCQKYHPGGFILFSRNFTDKPQLQKLCDDLHNWAAQQNPYIPLLIAVDHEGGRVQRFKKDFTVLPPAGEITTPEDAYKTGRIMGAELKSVGINMNMAPVLDIDSNPANPIIGDRAFGNTPEKVIELALPLIEGMREEGVIAVGKHFPGHGDTSKDSHKTLPVVEAQENILRKRELVPFKAAIDSNLKCVMTAHVLYPALDRDNPATLSPCIVNEILRREMNFDGIIISDDLLMGALNGCDIGETAFCSFLAGVDLLLICDKSDFQMQVFDYMKDSYIEGKIPEDRLNCSLERVLKIKSEYYGK